MKDKIEHKFKELLENQELPYDSAAWDSMSKLLDQKSPVAKPTNFYRWLLGGAAITAIAISSYFLLNSTERTEQPPKSTTEIESQKIESKNLTEENSKDNQLELNHNKSDEQIKLNANSNTLTDSEVGQIVTNSEINNEPINLSKQELKNTNYESNQTKNNPGELNSDLVENKSNNESRPELHSVICKNLCIGEVQTLENKHSFKVLVVNQNSGDVVATISENSKVLFEGKAIGIYVIKSNSTVLGSFEVTSGKKPTLEVESTITYNKGIPTLKATSSGESGLSWMVNNSTVASSTSEIEITPFKAGAYSVAVSSEDNGCKVENSQVIQVSEDYNLLAVNAFEPTSFEPKRQTFIPFALTQRDVKFTMIILDRRDGGIVYQTSDASMPWTGTDIRSGQMVNSGLDFIWKVQLVNPLPGESSEYKGIITKL